MKIEIENTLKRINDLIDNSDKDVFKAIEIMQLSQAVLSLSHAAATFHEMKSR